MNISVLPATLEIVPGEPATLSVEVTNTDDIICAYTLRVFGLDPAWVTLEEEQLSLFPDTSGFLVATIDVPRDLPAGQRQISIEVTDRTTDQVKTADVEIDVAPRREALLDLEPTTTVGGRSTDFGVVVTNHGNSPLPVSLSATDEEDHLRFTFEPDEVELAPGERITVAMRASGKRPLLANPAPRTFTVRTNDESPLETTGAFVQKPLLSRGLLGLFGLLMGISVFAVVITNGLSQVVDSSRANDDLLLDLLQAEDEAAALENPSSISGRVSDLATGEPVGGVTVQLFESDALNSPVGSSATSDDGAYQFGGLGPGAYKIRFQGAGFTEVWFPQATDPADAQDVELDVGDDRADVNVHLGGVPGSISGVVVGEDPTGAVVVLSIPAEVSGAEEDAELTSVSVDQTGEFELTDVPSPTTYRLTVEKEGFAAETRLIDLAAGEKKEAVEMLLRKGDGQISGRVFSEDGLLGGATITATDGITTVETLSLTRSDPGAFTLRELATPATYTLTIQREGFATQTITVPLSQAEQREGVDVTLSSSSGSISGVVSITGEGPAGGVAVTVHSGDLTLETVTLTAGDVGSYTVAGLPVPGSYTLTFSRFDLATQTRAVDLDPVRTRDVGGVNATMARSTATVFGTVSESSDGSPIAGAEISITGGDVELVARSADVPPGRYEVRGIQPGTYTVTFSRPGSEPRSVLVELAAGARRRVDATLGAPASISGTVRDADSNAVVPGAEVRLYRTSEFPTEVTAVAITDASGNYHFAAVEAPEQYTVTFGYPQGTPAQESQTVTLVAGEQRTGVDAEIEAGQADTA